MEKLVVVVVSETLPPPTHFQAFDVSLFAPVEKSTLRVRAAEADASKVRT